MRFAILISGRGSNMAALLRARAAGRLPEAQISLVLSNRADAPGLAVAESSGIPTIVEDERNPRRSRAAHEAAIHEHLKAAGVEAVVLAGYMRLLGGDLVTPYLGRMINIHPSLLPAFPGMHAQRQALEAGVRVTGCTVHFVDAGLDSGPILLQRSVPVHDDDTEDSLSSRILTEEHQAIVEAVDLISRKQLVVEGRRVLRLQTKCQGVQCV